MADAALDGLRVVEYGEMVSAPFAAKILADLGADVVKVEPPGGDPARRRGPFPAPGGREDPEKSALFAYLNANKRGVTLDLEQPAGRERLRELAGWSDVFIHNVSPRQAEALGLTCAELLEVNPDLIFAALTRWGLDGPYRDYAAYELTTMFGAGWGWLGPGTLDDRSLSPLKTAGQQADFQAGLCAAEAILASRYGQRRGRITSQCIDQGTMEVMADSKFNTGIAAYLVTGLVPDRFGTPVFGPSGNVECADGTLFVLCVEEHQWQALLDVIGHPEFASWEVFADPRARGINNDVLMPMVDALFPKDRTVGEICEWFQKLRIPAAPVNTMERILSFPQLLARDFWVNLEHPKLGSLRVPGAPYKLSETPWQMRRSAPLLGEHTDEIFCQRGDADSAPRAARTSVRPPASAAGKGEEGRALLSGIRVLDLTTMWAGPVATRELARLGAEVIRLETQTRTVSGNSVGAHGVVVSGYSSPAGYNQGKKSVLLDLHLPEGAAVGAELAASCDIVVENFAAGVVERLGLGYEALRKLNPSIIMVSASGYGATGPGRTNVAFGRHLSWTSGLNSLTGYPGGGPRELGIPYGDPNASQHVVVAALSALEYRERTGKGQFIDLSQLEAYVTLAVEGILAFELTGEEPARRGSHDSEMSPHNIYATLGEDEWVSIACANEEEWRAIVHTVGDPALAAAKFATAEERKAHEDELDAILGEWARSRSRFAVTDLLQAAGVAAFPVLTGKDLAHDPHLHARGFVFEQTAPDGSTFTNTGVPWHMQGAVHASNLRGPNPGEHTDEVLSTVLGFSPERIADLRERRVLA